MCAERVIRNRGELEGHGNVDSLRAAALGSGYCVTEKQVYSIMKAMDEDGTGKLSGRYIEYTGS